MKVICETLYPNAVVYIYQLAKLLVSQMKTSTTIVPTEKNCEILEVFEYFVHNIGDKSLRQSLIK